MAIVGYFVYDGEGKARAFFKDYDLAIKERGFDETVGPVDTARRDKFLSSQGAVATVPLKPIVPADISEPEELTDLERIFAEVEAEARKRAAKEYPGLKGKARDSVIGQYMLSGVLGRRQNLSTVEMAVIIQAGREQLWLSHPKGYERIHDWMRDAGMDPTKGHFYEYAALGESVIPALSAANVKIEDHLDQKTVGWVTEAAYHMRHILTRGGTVQDVVEVLESVRTAATRDAVRERYRTQRPKSARGGYSSLDGGSAMLVIHFDRQEDAATAQRRLSNVDWAGLVTTVREGNGYMEVTVQ